MAVHEKQVIHPVIEHAQATFGSGEKPCAALNAVQRELPVKRRKKLGLAQAAYLGAPFFGTSSAGQ